MTPEPAAARRPAYPRKQWGRGVRLLLWALRLYVLAAVPLVIYSFIRAALR